MAVQPDEPERTPDAGARTACRRARRPPPVASRSDEDLYLLDAPLSQYVFDFLERHRLAMSRRCCASTRWDTPALGLLLVLAEKLARRS